MPKNPGIPDQTIVNYILAGHTTREAKDHFGFPSDNIANLRVHAAFKRLHIKRPRYQKHRTCEFCRNEFTARDYKQRTCGSAKCQQALISDWQKRNPDKHAEALSKFRRTEKGRQHNIRTHRRIRQRGLYGTTEERWNYAAMESKKSLRKLKYLAIRHPWEYRIEHIQKMVKMVREITPRARRNLELTTQPNKSSSATSNWHSALRAVQTMLFQYNVTATVSPWERTVNRIVNSIRMSNRVRTWKRKQK